MASVFLTAPPPAAQNVGPNADVPTAIANERGASRAMLLTIMLAAAFLPRCANLGDWNFEVDDQYFALVGHRMLAGDMLYVDIFDRKGPALYLLYAALAAFGSSPVAYQLAGIVATALAGYGVARIAALIGAARGGIAAGIAYCLLTVAFGGANGQTPVFYNPWLIACAWCVISRIDLLSQGRIDGRIALGFAAAGLAIAFKMSAAFEGIGFGIVVLCLLVRARTSVGRMIAIVGLLGLVGMLPMLVAVAWYAWAGHFAELWQAVVASNFARTYDSAHRGARIGAALISILPLALVAVCGLVSLHRDGRFSGTAMIVAVWLGIAVLAIMAFPTVYSHYLLTLLAPLCIAAAGFYRHARWGAPLALALGGMYLVSSGELNFAERDRSRAESARLVEAVRLATPHHRLLVWGFPSNLYVLAAAKPPSVLAFAPHLFDGFEAGSSGLDEVAEVKRILAARPEAVVVQQPLPSFPVNARTSEMVDAYVARCGSVQQQALYTACVDP
jgi:hypothetical protein